MAGDGGEFVLIFGLKGLFHRSWAVGLGAGGVARMR